MTSSQTTALDFARVEFPEDAALPMLDRLFDAGWICAEIGERLPRHYGAPARIRLRHFIHSIGRRALASYELSWRRERYLPPEYFVAKTSGGGAFSMSRYPQDERLPGLQAAAQPGSALDRVNEHVLSMPVRRARVQLIRYRPEFRAVLRHAMGKVRLYARVMPPADAQAFLATQRVAAQSDFVVPGVAGCWQAGGVVWLTELRGTDMRRRIRKGRLPDIGMLLDGLASLWAVPARDSGLPPIRLDRAYRRALQGFRHNLRDHRGASQDLERIALELGAFVKSWRPTGMAHNDFYDDQLLVMPDGRLALVDLEDIAPGDPMLDVGNFLAHLRWSARFSSRGSRHCSRFHAELRLAALDRFGWQERDLAQREALCMFRVCTNAIRHPKADWKDKLDAGLRLVEDCLG